MIWTKFLKFSAVMSTTISDRFIFNSLHSVDIKFFTCIALHILTSKIISMYNDDHVIWQCNITCATSGAGTAYPPGVPEFTPAFCGVRVAHFLVFNVVFCRSLCVLVSCLLWPLYCSFSHCIVCPSIYGFSFGIFKRFLRTFLLTEQYNSNQTHLPFV